MEFPFFFDLNLASAILLRGPDGKILSAPFRVYEPLIKDVEEALIGELLGDGCLRYTGKILNGNPSLNKNVIFAMTLKSLPFGASTYFTCGAILLALFVLILLLDLGPLKKQDYLQVNMLLAVNLCHH